jgi:hypothetical protein
MKDPPPSNTPSTKKIFSAPPSGALPLCALHRFRRQNAIPRPPGDPPNFLLLAQIHLAFLCVCLPTRRTPFLHSSLERPATI